MLAEMFEPFLNKVAFTIILSVFFLSCWGEGKDPHTFSGGVARNGAALLTTLGILFTFIGITIGLYGFDINKIDNSINSLLEGMKLAFVSSVLGIGGAFTFKFYQIIQGKLRALQASAPTDIASEIYNKLEEMNEGIKNGIKGINEALGGEKDTSIISHLSKLRTTTTDKFDELKTEFKAFAETMAENNSKTLIAALEEVMRDFNAKINEQFGDNFKQLNEAVGKILEWQENYRVQLENLKEAYESSRESLEKSEAAIGKIGKHTEKIPAHLESMQAVMDKTQEQIEDLEQKLVAFVEMKEKAVNAMPDIQRNVTKFTEELKNSTQESISSIKESVQNQQKESVVIAKALKKSTQESISSMKESVQGQQKEIVVIAEALKKNIHESVSSMKESVQGQQKEIIVITKALKENIQESVSSMKESVQNQQKETGVLTEELRKNIQESVTSIKNSVQSQQETAKGINDLYQNFPKIANEAIQNSVNQFSTDMHTQINTSITSMGREITAITQTFSTQYRDIINSIGDSARQIGSITNSLRDMVNNINRR